MIVSAILAILTLAFVVLHGLVVWAGYKITTQFHKLHKEDMVGLGLIAASGLLHIINFIR